MKDGKDVAELQRRTKTLHQSLSSLKKLVNNSSSESALVHLHLATSTGSRASDERVLDEIVAEMRAKHRILLSRSKYVSQELFLPPPSIKVAVSSLHTDTEITEAVKLLSQVAEAKIN